MSLLSVILSHFVTLTLGKGLLCALQVFSRTVLTLALSSISFFSICIQVYLLKKPPGSPHLWSFSIWGTPLLNSMLTLFMFKKKVCGGFWKCPTQLPRPPYLAWVPSPSCSEHWLPCLWGNWYPRTPPGIRLRPDPPKATSFLSS